MAAPGFSKGEVSRAGQLLAEHLVEFRAGTRPAIVDPDHPADTAARDVVEWWAVQHVAAMLGVYEAVRGVAPALESIGGPAVSFRPKRFDSIIDKLTREPGKLADVVDIGGVRAVVDTQDDVEGLHGRLAQVLEVKRVRDWARNPRGTGYRAVHLHVRHQARMIEVQLRTFGQDAWANIVEEESRLSGVNYKSGQGDPAVQAFFLALSDIVATLELGESDPTLPTRFHEAYERARPRLRAPRLRGSQP